MLKIFSNINDGVSEICLLNGVDFLITRVAYSFGVVVAACITSSSPLHNSRQDEKRKRGIHLQEENNCEYLSTKDKPRLKCDITSRIVLSNHISLYKLLGPISLRDCFVLADAKFDANVRFPVV